MFKFSGLIDVNMAEEANDKRGIGVMLLQESVWKLEDKLSLVMESLADHEADLIRLRRLITLAAQRLHTLESRSTSTKYRKPEK